MITTRRANLPARADARTWHRLMFEKMGRVTEFERHVLPVILGVRPRSFLEVGCGMGYASAIVRATLSGCRVVATDVSPNYLFKHSRNVGRILGGVADAYIACNGERLPFRTGSFDVVYTAMVVYQMCDPLLAVEEFLRVGRLWLGLERATPRIRVRRETREMRSEAPDDDTSRFRACTLSDWHRLMKSVGGGEPVVVIPGRRFGSLVRIANAVRPVHVLLSARSAQEG